MEVFEERTSLLKLDGLTPAELGFICYAIQKAMIDAKKEDILYIDADINCPFYLSFEEAKALLEKIKKVCIRDEMRFAMGVDPEIAKIA